MMFNQSISTSRSETQLHQAAYLNLKFEEQSPSPIKFYILPKTKPAKAPDQDMVRAAIIQKNINLIRSLFTLHCGAYQELQTLHAKIRREQSSKENPFDSKKVLQAVHRAIAAAVQNDPLDIQLQQLQETISQSLNAINDAVKSLVEDHLYLASVHTKRYHEQTSAEDLYHEGVIGLITAAYKFDPDKGVKFSTYATYWMRQTMNRAKDTLQNGPKLSHRAQALKRRFHLTASKLAHQLGREATDDEIMEAAYMNSEEIEMVRANSQSVFSLDQPVTNESNTTHIDLLADKKEQSIQLKVEQKLRIDAINKVLQQLPERKAEILRLRFGIGHSRPYSLAEVGTMLAVSKERIRQLETQAKRQLQHQRYKLAENAC